MKLLKIFPVIFLLLQTGESIAQIKFQIGYYINSSQDTVHGYIQKRMDKKKYDFFSFRSDFATESFLIYPSDAIMYSIDGEIFESHRFNENDSIQLHAFFKVILVGKLSLLRYNFRYFAKTLTNELYDITNSNERLYLENKYKYTSNEIVKVKKIDFSTLGTLIYLMQDCDQITQSYLLKKYKSNPDYKKILTKYNQCVNQ